MLTNVKRRARNDLMKYAKCLKTNLSISVFVHFYAKIAIYHYYCHRRVGSIKVQGEEEKDEDIL